MAKGLPRWAWTALVIALLGVGYLVLQPAAPTTEKNVGLPAGAALLPTVEENGKVFQQFTLRALQTGTYDKTAVAVKKGIPVKLSFSADRFAGCGRELVIRAFGIDLISRSGEAVTAEFTPTKTGIVPYSCSMNMFRGKMYVVE